MIVLFTIQVGVESPLETGLVTVSQRHSIHENGTWYQESQSVEHDKSAWLAFIHCIDFAHVEYTKFQEESIVYAQLVQTIKLALTQAKAISAICFATVAEAALQNQNGTHAHIGDTTDTSHTFHDVDIYGVFTHSRLSAQDRGDLQVWLLHQQKMPFQEHDTFCSVDVGFTSLN